MLAWETLLLFRRSLRRSVQLPTALLAFLISPLLLLWGIYELFGAIPRAIAHFPASDYLTFIGPAVAVAGVLPGALWCGASLLADRESGLLEQLLAAPIARTSIPCSNTVAAATGAVLTSLAVLLTAILCGMQIHSGLVAVLAILPLSIALSVIYTNVAFLLVLLIHRRSTLTLLWETILAMTLLVSDLILPNQLLPSWLTSLAMINPLSYAIQDARTLLLAHPSWIIYTHDLAVLACLALGLLVASVVGFNRYAERA